MSKIIVRFAPSPTGMPHLGNIRVALFNYLFAKHYKGNLILRIEDTDLERIIPKSVEAILESLYWLGLKWNKLYFQSKRLKIYQKYAQELLEKGKAYRCFCSEETLKEMRDLQILKKQASMYDQRCRNLTKEEINKKLKLKISYVIRLKVPLKGKIKFNDLIRGEVEIENKLIGDQILLKSNGYPTYHLASVADDHLMKITHIIRGEDWLPSTPKHILLYKAFEWEIPKFAHLPMILGKDKEKLSKRYGAIGILELREMGYLKEALISFIALLGWNPKTEKEFFSLEELIKEFSLKNIQKNSAIFNFEKLDYLNGFYIRKLSLDKLTNLIIPFLEKANLIKKKDNGYLILDNGKIIGFNYLKKIVALEQERIKKLSEIGERAKFFFLKELEYNPKILFWKNITKDDLIKNLSLIEEKIVSIRNFNKENLDKELRELAKEKGTGEIFWPFRVALTGLEGSPPPCEIAEILGKGKTLKRVKEALKLLKT